MGFKGYIVLVSLLVTVFECQSSLTLNDSVGAVEENHCLPWQARNDREKCKCSRTFHATVICQNDPYRLFLFACFCMSHYNKTDQYVVGPCQYNCKITRGYYNNITTNTSSGINGLICSKYKRQGQLCGSCMPGYAPPAYSYSLSCVKCNDSHWVKYTVVSLLPLTLFYIVIITMRVSVTSPKLNGLIIFFQLIFSASNLRLYHSETYQYQTMLITLIGILNLDFFRIVYTPFCLHPGSDNLEMLSLDYIIAVYPLLLILLSYSLVLLYDKNVRFIVCLWKPFVPFFIRFRRQWNIRHSLVDAFATFLLLSYVKILSVSVDLLTPVILHDQTHAAVSQLYLFNQGDVPFLGSHHFPYACLALFFLVTFTLLPMLLLFFYPCSCFQRCINHSGYSCHSLHIFMDTFQGHYKNGMDGTRDFRFFSGLYLLLRVVVYSSIVVTYQIASYIYTVSIIALLAISIALVQPYKKYIHNVIEVCFLTLTQIGFMALRPLVFGRFSLTEEGLGLLGYIILPIPFLYISALLVWQIKSQCNVVQCVQNICGRVKSYALTSPCHTNYENLH